MSHLLGQPPTGIGPRAGAGGQRPFNLGETPDTLVFRVVHLAG